MPSAGVRAIRSSSARRRRCGDDDRAVFDERAIVHQVGDVLTSGATTNSATLPDCRWPSRVEPDRVAGDHLCQVGTNVRRVFRRLGGRSGDGDLAGGEAGDDRVLHHGRAHGHDQRFDRPIGRRLDGVVHLHRLDQHHLLARPHLLADHHVDRDDRALHRCRDVHRFPHARDGSRTPCRPTPRTRVGALPLGIRAAPHRRGWLRSPG